MNLTPPQAHFEVSMRTVEAGKSLYNEKPLTVTRGEAAELLDAAGRKGVLVGCAPDTFMGSALQTAGRLAAHILEIMHGFHDASDRGEHIQLETTCDRPAALPADLEDGDID